MIKYSTTFFFQWFFEIEGIYGANICHKNPKIAIISAIPLTINQMFCNPFLYKKTKVTMLITMNPVSHL